MLQKSPFKKIFQNITNMSKTNIKLIKDDKKPFVYNTKLGMLSGYNIFLYIIHKNFIHILLYILLRVVIVHFAPALVIKKK